MAPWPIPTGDGVMILSTDQGATTPSTSHGDAGICRRKSEGPQLPGGGGFRRASEDVTVQHHAAQIAYLTSAPVKVKLTRGESILIHPNVTPWRWSSPSLRSRTASSAWPPRSSPTPGLALSGRPVLEGPAPPRRSLQLPHFEIDGWAYNQQPPRRAFPGVRCHPDLLLHREPLK